MIKLLSAATVQDGKLKHMLGRRPVNGDLEGGLVVRQAMCLTALQELMDPLRGGLGLGMQEMDLVGANSQIKPKTTNSKCTFWMKPTTSCCPTPSNAARSSRSFCSKPDTFMSYPQMVSLLKCLTMALTTSWRWCTMHATCWCSTQNSMPRACNSRSIMQMQTKFAAVLSETKAEI